MGRVTYCAVTVCPVVIVSRHQGKALNKGPPGCVPCIFQRSNRASDELSQTMLGQPICDSWDIAAYRWECIIGALRLIDIIIGVH